MYIHFSQTCAEHGYVIQIKKGGTFQQPSHLQKQVRKKRPHNGLRVAGIYFFPC